MCELRILLHRIAKDLDASVWNAEKDAEEADEEVREKARITLADTFFEQTENLLLLLDAPHIPVNAVHRIRRELDIILCKPFDAVLRNIGMQLYKNEKPATKPESIIYRKNFEKLRTLCEDFTLEYIELIIEAPDFPVSYRTAIQVVIDILFPQMDETEIEDSSTE